LKMKRIDWVLKKLSDLYEFNRKLRAYHLKSEAPKPIKKDTPKLHRTGVDLNG